MLADWLHDLHMTQAAFPAVQRLLVQSTMLKG
jgi:hypothetical protein